MIILKAIGSFFAKIGRWIKETAWVQPLLIVGAIFAVIFSIPHIVNWVSSWFASGNEYETFYGRYQVSLNGAVEHKSDADKLMQYLENRNNGTATSDEINKYGDQFFLTFYQSGCSGCEDTFPGFETLQANFNSGEFTVKEMSTGYKSSTEFKYFTIKVDESTDDELTGSETSFDKLFDNYPDFFEEAVTSVEDRPYYHKQGGSSSTYASLLEDINDINSFQTPTTFMIDFNYPEASEYGIVDIIFNFDGKDNKTTATALARTLIDCWNHVGVFSEEEND